MEEDLVLSVSHVDFGTVDYALGLTSDDYVVRVTNTSTVMTYELDLDVISMQSGEFPVKVHIRSPFVDQGTEQKIVIAPGSTIPLPLVLQPIAEAMRSMGQRTSYFNVSSRCYLQYHSQSNNVDNTIPEKRLEFTFSASLCTSLMHVENADLRFNECVKRDTYMQEITIWNRSESQLQFEIKWDNTNSTNEQEKKNKRAVKFYEAEELREIDFGEVLIVPSFAPRILVVRVMAEVRGKCQLNN